ncbi:MAG: NUDIX hydrolase [Nevskia sp.]|nr:NUDIX hydrolase [Nevskia sp.]
MSTIETLYRGDYLILQRDGHWEYVSRPSARGAAFILAVTDAREIVLVEQFRVPLRARAIELPAGIIGDEVGFADEAIDAAALRELEEETGFRAESAEHLLSGPNAGGMTSEILHLIYARKLTRVHQGGGVAGEDITVHVVPLADVAQWLHRQGKSGKWIDPRIYMGLWFAEHRSTS